MISPQAPIVLWTCDPQDWGQNMAVVLHPQPPIWILRYHFIARQVGYDWRPVLPEGFALERMGEGLRQVNWTCDAGNPGSIRTAEKLGLGRIDDYQMGILLFDQSQQLELFRQFHPHETGATGKS